VLFDFDNSESISLEELITIFMCVVIGFCRLTETEIPNFKVIETFAKLVN